MQWFPTLWHLHVRSCHKGKECQQRLSWWPSTSRQWPPAPVPPAPSPGCRMTRLSAQLSMKWTQATGHIITGSQTNKKEEKSKELFSPKHVFLQADCPNPCAFLAVTAGGQNREQFHNNQSQVTWVLCLLFFRLSSFQVYFYFQSKTMINKESLLYTALSLFAEIGG